MNEFVLLAVLAVGVVAFLYSSVGHAGASGYIAVLTLLGYGVVLVRPTALLLNVLVATIATWQFWHAGHFSWSLFWPFAILSVPMAFLGGYLQLPANFLAVLVGVVLLASAFRFAWRPAALTSVRPVKRPIALIIGGVIGLLSGLTGTGGGIFLTPILLLSQWAPVRRAAAVSAPFILVNSVAGLGGYVAAGLTIPAVLLPLALAAVAGGTLGSHLGSRRFSPRALQGLLALVLVIAGTKLILGSV
ncbi:MAG TPA: sulfite exporter TauE/SafE family protein [Gemmatimonadota bacterium]|nr:sulfite exporter TauE/SafE family protein [Gemmatimonadota bacterium]